MLKWLSYSSFGPPDDQDAEGSKPGEQPSAAISGQTQLILASVYQAWGSLAALAAVAGRKVSCPTNFFVNP